MKPILLFLLLFIGVADSALAQKEEKSPTSKFLHKRGYVFPGGKKNLKRSTKWPDTLYYNTTYKSKLMGSVTIPITFSRVEFVDGKYQVTPTIGFGLGYTWFLGKFIFSENDKIIVDPTLFFGLVADIGVQNDFNLFRPAGFFTGAFVGTSAISLFFGYDFVTQSPTLGLGSRIDLYTLSQKFLNPIGNVRPVRKHKRRATPIIDE